MTDVLQQMMGGHQPPKSHDAPPVPYRVQLAMSVVQMMYSAKTTHGVHAATGAAAPATELNEKERQLYHQCIEVVRTWISGENDHDPPPVDDDADAQ